MEAVGWIGAVPSPLNAKIKEILAGFLSEAGCESEKSLAGTCSIMDD